jgi:Co/Zn/Cd efflux system component
MRPISDMHSHSISHEHRHHHERRTRLVAYLTAATMVVEITFGYDTNSLAKFVIRK